MTFEGIFFFNLILLPSSAVDFNQTLPDNFKSDYETDKHEASLEYIQGVKRKDEMLFKKRKESPYFSEDKKSIVEQQKESFSLIQSELPGKYEDSQKYKEHNNLDIIASVADLAKSAFSLSYFKDNYDYTGARSFLFEDIYERSTGSQRLGLLLFSQKQYVIRSIFPVAVGWNVGIGYNKGRGRFTVGGNESDAVFTLWTIPVDFAVSMEFPLRQWIKITGSGGPSIMGLYQTRSDFSSEDTKKHRRQLGVGFFLASKLQFNISKFFPSRGIETLADNQVSSLFVNLEARMQNYRRFQDSFAITGISFGLGFSFEFL